MILLFPPPNLQSNENETTKRGRERKERERKKGKIVHSKAHSIIRRLKKRTKIYHIVIIVITLFLLVNYHFKFQVSAFSLLVHPFITKWY